MIYMCVGAYEMVRRRQCKRMGKEKTEQTRIYFNIHLK